MMSRLCRRQTQDLCLEEGKLQRKCQQNIVTERYRLIFRNIRRHFK